jgi:hypothetical protein
VPPGSSATAMTSGDQGMRWSSGHVPEHKLSRNAEARGCTLFAVLPAHYSGSMRQSRCSQKQGLRASSLGEHQNRYFEE